MHNGVASAVEIYAYTLPPLFQNRIELFAFVDHFGSHEFHFSQALLLRGSIRQP